MNIFLSFIRVLYTGVLIVFGLALIPYYSVMISGSANGHGLFSIFSYQAIVPVLLFGLLFIARLLQSQSPKWLLLGLPAILAIAGFAGFIGYLSVVVG